MSELTATRRKLLMALYRDVKNGKRPGTYTKFLQYWAQKLRIEGDAAKTR